MVGGKVVHGGGEFESLAPTLPPPMPDWSPVGHYGGYQGATLAQATAAFAASHTHVHGEACHVHGTGTPRTMTRPSPTTRDSGAR